MADITWGILATGKIAKAFTRDLQVLPDARVGAVASRTQESAEEFAAAFAIPTAYADYERLAEDPSLDIVYVASPHGLHHRHARMLLEAGKPVLCEKAVTLNADQAADLVRLAQDKGVFFMEAMWMACHPLIRHLRRLLHDGEFGRPRQLVADLGFVVDAPPTSRLLDPALGGGALLDVGIYPLTIAHLLLGEPTALAAVAELSDAGVDLDIAISARYADGAVAALTGSMTSLSPRSASIATNRGRLDVPADFHHPTHALWTDASGSTRRIDPPEPVLGRGLANEAAEVMRCLRAGETQSPLVPHEQTLSIMRQMDEIRRLVGVRYPGAS